MLGVTDIDRKSLLIKFYHPILGMILNVFLFGITNIPTGHIGLGIVKLLFVLLVCLDPAIRQVTYLGGYKPALFRQKPGIILAKSLSFFA